MNTASRSRKMLPVRRLPQRESPGHIVRWHTLLD
jgi:hypothetical protein